MEELSKEQLEILVNFLGCQNMTDTRYIIEKYKLSLDFKKTERVIQELFELLDDELVRR